MAKKKIGSHWYSETSSRIRHGLFTERTLEGNRLFAQGMYPTNLTAKDLPEYFKEIYLRGKIFIDTKNVVDVVYKPNYFTDNHLFKDDFLYISWKEELRLSENERWSFYENYDKLLWGWPIMVFVESALKYTEGEIHAKLEAIHKKLFDKITWYAHVDPERHEMPSGYPTAYPEVTFIVRPMGDLYRPMSEAEQKEAMERFCERCKCKHKNTISVNTADDARSIARSLPDVPLDAIIRPVFLFVDTERYGDPKRNDQVLNEIYREFGRSRCTLCSVFVRKELNSDRSAE